MKIIHPDQCPIFIAGDLSILREIINPRKSKLKTSYSLARARVKKSKKTLPHRLKYIEVYYIVKGKGMMYIDKQRAAVNKDDAIYIPAGAVQYIENTGRAILDFLCIVNPPWEPACETVLVKNGHPSKPGKH